MRCDAMPDDSRADARRRERTTGTWRLARARTVNAARRVAQPLPVSRLIEVADAAGVAMVDAVSESTNQRDDDDRSRLEKFWRDENGGCSASKFHTRPPSAFPPSPLLALSFARDLADSSPGQGGQWSVEAIWHHFRPSAGKRSPAHVTARPMTGRPYLGPRPAGVGRGEFMESLLMGRQSLTQQSSRHPS